MAFTTRADIKAILDAYTFTGKSGLTGEPLVRLSEVSKGTTKPENGEIILKKNSLNNDEDLIFVSNLSYRIDISVKYMGQTSMTLVMALLWEIRLALKAATLTVPRTARYNLLFDHKAVVTDEVKTFIDVVEELVSNV